MKSVANEPSQEENRGLDCRGVHHLALNTDDMKVTIDFYSKVLGMPLVHALKVAPGLGTGAANRGNPPFENVRHYFFDMGNDSLLAFFEIPKGEKPKGDRNAIGSMQHVSFVVRPAEAFEALQDRLKAAGVEILGPTKMASGPGFSIYFYDPNGIRLEASCEVNTLGDPNVVRHATQSRRELQDELLTLSNDQSWINGVIEHIHK